MVPTKPCTLMVTCRRCSFCQLADDDQTVAGIDAAAETDVVHAAEADEVALEQLVLGDVVTAHLGPASHMSTPGSSG